MPGIITPEHISGLSQHWSSLVMLQMNTSKNAISVVQPQLRAAQQKPSAMQQNRVGALVTHHLAWMSHHTGGSQQRHPRYTSAQQWEGRGWPDQEISQSAAHRHTKCKSCLTLSFLFSASPRVCSTFIHWKGLHNLGDQTHSIKG